MQIQEHSVRERAYYIWESEGRVHGRAASHWVRAEAELTAAARTGAVEASEPAAKTAKPVAVKAAPKAATAKPASRTAVAKTPTPKDVAPKAAAKPAKASKAAVTAGLAAKAKPARVPSAMH